MEDSTGVLFLRQRLRRSDDLVSVDQSEFNDEISNLRNVITRAVLQRESNTVLLIGPEGAGKTRILNTVLHQVRQNLDVKSRLIEVILNGLLQTDDRIALEEITRQLTLKVLLEQKELKGFAENLRFLLKSLNNSDGQSKSVLFILDEFDLFCHHKNQTLLYNLFDVAQSAQLPIAVVGLTCKMDILDLLEKRVRSRFSHRQIYVFPRHSFQEYIQIAENLLSLPSNCKMATEWNNSIQVIFQNETVLSFMKRYFNTTKNIRALKKLLMLIMAHVNPSDNALTTSAVIDSYHLLAVNSKTAMLTGLSRLELCLILSMASLTIKYEGEGFNLQMVYNEYLTFVCKCSTVQTFEFPVVTKTFERLQALEIVKPVSNVSGRSIPSYQMMMLLVDRSQITEAIQSYPGLSTEIQQWAKSLL